MTRRVDADFFIQRALMLRMGEKTALKQASERSAGTKRAASGMVERVLPI